MEETPEASMEDIDEEMGMLTNLVQESEAWSQEGSEGLRLRGVLGPPRCSRPHSCIVCGGSDTGRGARLGHG
eukprot:4905136-Alexandrium_andersonii.AAC.1